MHVTWNALSVNTRCWNMTPLFVTTDCRSWTWYSIRNDQIQDTYDKEARKLGIVIIWTGQRDPTAYVTTRHERAQTILTNTYVDHLLWSHIRCYCIVKLTEASRRGHQMLFVTKYSVNCFDHEIDSDRISRSNSYLSFWYVRSSLRSGVETCTRTMCCVTDLSGDGSVECSCHVIKKITEISVK